MAISYYKEGSLYLGLSTDDKTSISNQEGAKIYYTDTNTTQICHKGNWYGFSEPVSITGSLANQPFGPSNLTSGSFTFSKSQNGFAISNDGTTNLTCTIGTDTYIVMPSEVFQQQFAPFTTIAIASTGTLAFRAWGLI